MPATMPATSDWLKVDSLDMQPIEGAVLGKSDLPQVDRKNSRINGVLIAESGKFKDGRGYFTERSLSVGVQLANQMEKGIKSRLQHPNMSDDGLAKFLGRQTNNRIEHGKWYADLLFDKSSFIAPSGDLATYVMDRAESDPESFGTSLVSKFDFFDAEGKQLTRDEMFDAWDNNPGTVHWVPTELHASDVVDEGNATSSFLSVDNLPDAEVRQATESLNTLFANQSRDVVESRCTAFLTKYLDHRYGVSEMPTENLIPETDVLAPTGDTVVKDNIASAAAPLNIVKAEPLQPATVAETLAPLVDAKSEAQLQADRAVEISQLCLLAGCAEKSGPMIANLNLSAADVREHLHSQMSARNSLSTSVQSDETEPLSQEDKDKAEYEKDKAHYQRHGVSLEAFLCSCETDRNHGFISPKKAEGIAA